MLEQSLRYVEIRVVTEYRTTDAGQTPRYTHSHKHHTYTVFEAMLRISLVMQHVKCITLVYPAVYPNAYHMNDSLLAV